MVLPTCLKFVAPWPGVLSHGDKIRASIKRSRESVGCGKVLPMPPVPLNNSELFLFHGGDTGSTPVRDANTLQAVYPLSGISPHVEQNVRELITEISLCNVAGYLRFLIIMKLIATCIRCFGKMRNL